LLCGAGESGKTTFTRQLKLKFLPSGISDEDREAFAPIIRGNLVETMQLLLDWIDQNGYALNEALDEFGHLVGSAIPFACEFTDELSNALSELWADPVVQTAFSHKDETTIPDHMDYFFGRIEQLSEDGYLPTDEDILRARIRTVGISSITFDTGGLLVRFYDVGGQKNERGKWAQVNEEVRGVVFCVSFADFDKPMFEELPTRVARILDALDIFAELVQREKFRAAPFFFVANKFDAFSEKVRSSDCFVRLFPDYQGDPHDVDACAEYLTNEFLKRAEPRSDAQPIRVFRQTALEPETVVANATAICTAIKMLAAAS
jgi:GTPase SAR1 family protein